MRQLELTVENFLNKLPIEYDELLNCHDVRVRHKRSRGPALFPDWRTAATARRRPPEESDRNGELAANPR